MILNKGSQHVSLFSFNNLAGIFLKVFPFVVLIFLSSTYISFIETFGKEKGVFVITSLIFNILGWSAYFRIAACTGSFILSMVFIQFIVNGIHTIYCQWYSYNLLSMVFIQFIVNGIHTIYCQWCQWYSYNILSMVFIQFIVNGIHTIYCQWYSYNLLSMVFIQFIVNGIHTIYCQWYSYNILSMVFIQYIVNGIHTIYCQWYSYNLLSMVFIQFIVNGIHTIYCQWYSYNLLSMVFIQFIGVCMFKVLTALSKQVIKVSVPSWSLVINLLSSISVILSFFRPLSEKKKASLVSKMFCHLWHFLDLPFFYIICCNTSFVS